MTQSFKAGRHPLRRVCRLFFWVCLTAGISACAPSMYQRPVTKFKTAIETSRDLYFDQLKEKKLSDVEKFTIQRYLARSWTKKADGTVLGMDKTTADRIAQEKTRPFLDRESLSIRQQAFDIILFYSETLIALASDEKTGRLTAEVNGFKEDTIAFVKQAEQMSQAADLGDFGRIADFVGPFGSAVKAFELIAKTISELVREKAIRQAIVQADPMIEELLSVLGNEAALAQASALENYEIILGQLNQVIDKENFADNSARQMVFDAYSTLSTRVQMITAFGEKGEMRSLFESARSAHAELLRQASGMSLEALPQQIEKFRQRTLLLRQVFDDIHS